MQPCLFSLKVSCFITLTAFLTAMTLQVIRENMRLVMISAGVYIQAYLVLCLDPLYLFFLGSGLSNNTFDLRGTKLCFGLCFQSHYLLLDSCLFFLELYNCIVLCSTSSILSPGAIFYGSSCWENLNHMRYFFCGDLWILFVEGGVICIVYCLFHICFCAFILGNL